MKYEKQFLIVGNQNAISYKEVFPPPPPTLPSAKLAWNYRGVRGGRGSSKLLKVGVDISRPREKLAAGESG
jgi:hypothetical protein